MDSFSTSIQFASFEMSARDRIKFKDITDAVKIDEYTANNGSFTAEIAGYVILNIHNPKSKNNPDYHNYVYIGTDGKKYVSGSESLWNAFSEIKDELAADNDTDPITLTFYRVPSKNYAGKDFLSCSLA